MPVILVADSGLGGISLTISAFESLKIRGYDVESVLIFENDRYQNHEYLASYFKEHDVPVHYEAQPFDPSDNEQVERQRMKAYYKKAGGSILGMLKHLDKCHHERVARLEDLSIRAHKHIWYPFTQHKQLSPAKLTTTASAYGDHFQTLVPQGERNGNASLLQPSFDGSASWWTQGLGHGNSRLTLAAAYAAGRYGHVMFAEAIHEPAMELASELLRTLKNPRMSRVFYSDNGSTGMEVAVKMALRASRLRYGWAANEGLEILGLKGSYHGDTIGAMDSAEPSVFTDNVEWYEGKGFWFDHPSIVCKDGKWHVRVPSEIGQSTAFDSLTDVFDLETRKGRGQHHQYANHVHDVLDRLRKQGRKFGALMMEPIVLGAGGMILV